MTEQQFVLTHDDAPAVKAAIQAAQATPGSPVQIEGTAGTVTCYGESGGKQVIEFAGTDPAPASVWDLPN